MDENRNLEVEKTSEPGKATDQKFSLLARKVRRRRIVGTVLLVFVVILATVCIVNYKAAVTSQVPPIVLGRGGVDNGQTDTTVYYSLGFKQVVYESEYGRNYSMRLWPWEKVEENPPVLTAEQYRQMTEQLEKRNKDKADYSKYFNVFKTFDASILDVEQDKNQYRIYLKGAAYQFFEYRGNVYENVDGAPESRYKGFEQQPMIVTAVWDGKTFKIQDVKDYELGDGGSRSIYESFPKPVAVRLNTWIEGQTDWGQKAVERSRLKAAAHFGKPLADGTYLFFNEETSELELYQEVPDCWDPSGETGPQDNDVLIEKKPMKELKEQV
ncbi:hypothetical protein NE619_03135 [Anaerovorax odorimutans]|uniref:Uncharacterized protein n=1 Tax=Anaerovorax odorimutans TaxID=109327 RepID=A0ABT1RKK7_9FIRM|nr:hypothetical protein [Anaerovorax odorimutans]MCQ4635712.1 hypothetical protein [Anaerovorax odorimutans]